MRRNDRTMINSINAYIILFCTCVLFMAYGYIMDYNMMVSVFAFMAGFAVYKINHYYQLWKR